MASEQRSFGELWEQLSSEIVQPLSVSAESSIEEAITTAALSVARFLIIDAFAEPE